MATLKERVQICINESSLITNKEVIAVWYKLKGCDPDECKQLAKELKRNIDTCGGEFMVNVSPMYIGDDIESKIFAHFKGVEPSKEMITDPESLDNELDDLYKDAGDATDRYHR